MYPCIQPQADSLDMRLEEINSFYNSIQTIKDIQNFNYHKLKIKKKTKTDKIEICLIQSTDGVLLLGVSSTAITLSVTGIGLIVVPE